MLREKYRELTHRWRRHIALYLGFRTFPAAALVFKIRICVGDVQGCLGLVV